MKSNPGWIGQIKKNQERRSYDNGKTFKIETNQVLHGSFYFLNEEFSHTDRDSYNFT